MENPSCNMSLLIMTTIHSFLFLHINVLWVKWCGATAVPSSLTHPVILWFTAVDLFKRNKFIIFLLNKKIKAVSFSIHEPGVHGWSLCNHPLGFGRRSWCCVWYAELLLEDVTVLVRFFNYHIFTCIKLQLQYIISDYFMSAIVVHPVWARWPPHCRNLAF